MAFTLDTSQIDKFARNLADAAPKAARAAASAALNRTAKGAELLAKKTIKTNFEVRNKWTLGSVVSTKTPPTRPIDRQFTLVGSKQAYLAKQEHGGALSRSSEGRRLTTSRGSREGATAHPRKKLARGRLANRNIKLKRRGGRTGSKGRIAKRAVESARSKRAKFVFLDLGGDKKGIFEVKKTKIVMVHRFIRRTVRVKANPWLAPSVAKSRRIAPKVFKAEMERAVRAGLFA